MTQKHELNNFKLLLGIDQNRTASQKLLDKAIGVNRKVPMEIKEEKQPQKKVKQEHSNLTQAEVLKKLVKNIESNSNASKLIKPINILKKCFEDHNFVCHPEIDTNEQWNSLIGTLTSIDQKLVGNYNQIVALNDVLLQLVTHLQNIFKKNEGKMNECTKKEQDKNQPKIQEDKQKLLKEQRSGAYICEYQILFYKMFTDDNFVFQKTLSQIKAKIFNYFKERLEGKTEQYPQLFTYLQNYLIKMFKLPFKQYEWIKTSLNQFFKEFNINYKHLLDPELANKYLQQYNIFINSKNSKGTGGDVNIFGTGNKGKVTHIEVVKGDGYDAWTSKQ